MTPAIPQFARKTLAVALGLAYVFAFLSGFAHELETAHAVCPEHDHLIHVELGDEHAAKTDTDPKPAAVEAPEPGHLGGHDHCTLVLTLLQGHFVLDPPPTATLPPDAILTSLPLVVAPSTPIRGPTRAIYGYAPKTSPPHHA